jgi:hypothetical protein
MAQRPERPGPRDAYRGVLFATVAAVLVLTALLLPNVIESRAVEGLLAVALLSLALIASFAGLAFRHRYLQALLGKPRHRRIGLAGLLAVGGFLTPYLVGARWLVIGAVGVSCTALAVLAGVLTGDRSPADADPSD